VRLVGVGDVKGEAAPDWPFSFSGRLCGLDERDGARMTMRGGIDRNQ